MISKRIEDGKIVVPWNFSSLSMTALDAALKIAGNSSQIRVMHVATPQTDPGNHALGKLGEGHEIQDLNQRFHEQIGPDERFRNVQFHVCYGDVAQEIVRFAESYRAGLIVMASRRRKGLFRLLSGGLAERVVRQAKCPVLTVPNDGLGIAIKNTRWQSFGIRPIPPEKVAVSYRHGM